MKRCIKSARFQAPKNWKMYGEYADGYEIEVTGWDIGDCMGKLEELESQHGELVFYTGVNDDEYIDGEYFDEEERAEWGWEEY